MFTGIVRYIFNILCKFEKLYLIGNEDFIKLLRIGCSVCINGVCLTLVSVNGQLCGFDLSQETLKKTNLGTYTTYMPANVELGLIYGSRIDGHLISGHVYGTRKALLDGSILKVYLDPEDMKFVSYKGSIAVNGVSLTISNVDDYSKMIEVALIPETLQKTTFGKFNGTETVNVEFDQINTGETLKEVPEDSYYMNVAFEESLKGRRTSFPNPWVGCVIVKNGEIISKGYHASPDKYHAEADALHNIGFFDFCGCQDYTLCKTKGCKYYPGDEILLPKQIKAASTKRLEREKLKDSVLYCTLEPCINICGNSNVNNLPKFPQIPCSPLIVKSGIKKVVIGILDPDERVTGKGVFFLKNAGIEVILLSDIDQKLYEKICFSLRSYIHHRKTLLPYVIAKVALTTDGCYRGDEKWITHEGSRMKLYKEWEECQAVIIGAATVQYDNPTLTTFDSNPNGKSKTTSFKKIVIDGECLTSTLHSIFSDPHVQVVTSDYTKWEGVLHSSKIILVENTKNLKDVLYQISKANNHVILQIMVEGGGILHNSFFEQNLVNELLIFRGSKLFGTDGNKWCVSPSVLDLQEVKTIEFGGVKNIMERYLVNRKLLLEEESFNFDNIEYALREFAKGGMIVVMDDESRENEGDLVVSAAKMTEYQMTEMINNTSGIICAPMDKKRALELNLGLLFDESSSTDKNKTPFASSVDHKDTATGISSKDRLKTVNSLADLSTKPFDLNRPGHIFPLIANPMLFDARKGHTEASVAMCVLTSVYPRVAVIGELKNQNGSIKNRKECFKYAKEKSIPIISIEQLVLEMKKFDYPRKLSESRLKLKYGEKDWIQMCFESGDERNDHLVLFYSPENFLDPEDILPVRVHSECFSGDVLGSLMCDCGPQLGSSMKYIVEKKCGIVIFPANHEGRGIGRRNKVSAYNLKEKLNLGTFDANEMLGFPKDARTYEDIPKILKKLGVSKIELLTENPDKISVLEEFLVLNTPILTSTTNENFRYMEEKRESFKDNCFGNREKEMNKAFPEVDDFERNGNYKIGIVYAKWHEQYITRIRTIIKENFCNLGILAENIIELEVPGSAELSYGASLLEKRENIDGVIVVGILIKGDTFHFESVASGVFSTVGNVRDVTGLPIINATMACYNYSQVEERISGNKSTLEYLSRSLIKLIIEKNST